MKPTTLEEALSLVPTHWPLTQDVCDNCRRRIDGAGWFTAKETAEIAKAYGRACLHSYMDKAADTVERFENLFEEWSK